MIFSKTSAATLAAESDKILDVFTKTIDDLTKSIDKHEEYHAELKAKKAEIEAEEDAVFQNIERNKSVIDKINKFFN